MAKYFCILFFTTSFLFSQQEKTIVLNTFDAEQAFILQKKNKKPIVFFFYTDWCKYCFAMKKNTLTNTTVIGILNDNFYFVPFDAESKTPVKIKKKTFRNSSGVHELAERLASKNGYLSYPTLVILNHKNRINEQADTFLTADALEKLLKTYLKKKKL